MNDCAIARATGINRRTVLDGRHQQQVERHPGDLLHRLRRLRRTLDRLSDGIVVRRASQRRRSPGLRHRSEDL